MIRVARLKTGYSHCSFVIRKCAVKQALLFSSFSFLLPFVGLLPCLLLSADSICFSHQGMPTVGQMKGPRKEELGNVTSGDSSLKNTDLWEASYEHKLLCSGSCIRFVNSRYHWPDVCYSADSLVLKMFRIDAKSRGISGMEKSSKECLISSKASLCFQ